jgi:flagellar hook assembly protein FlgD
MHSGESVLLRLESAEMMQRAPLVTRVRLNEGLIGVASVSRPMEFTLEQNVPNPFNPQTTVRFSVAEAGQVQLIVYSATGQCVRILVDGTLEAGTHDVVWDGRDAAGREVASGVYLCRLTAEQGVRVRRMVLLK